MNAEEIRKAVKPYVPGWTVYPKRFAVMGDEITATVAIQFQALAIQMYSGFWAPLQANANDGDEYTFGICVAAGNYTFHHLAVKGSIVANIDWYVDGVKVVSGRDWYAASNTVFTDSFAVTLTAGYHTIKLKANGHNVSSTDYVIRITKIWGKQATD